MLARYIFVTVFFRIYIYAYNLSNAWFKIACQANLQEDAVVPRILLLLLPSLSSGTLTLLTALTLLAASGWSYINDNLLFYDQLFGIYGFKTLLLQSDGLYALQHALLDSSITYYILLVATGITVGLIVYTLLEAARVTVHTTAEELHEIGDTDPAHKTAAREALERLLLRVTGLVGWGVYVAVFVSILLPFSIVLAQTGIDMLETSRIGGVVHCVGAFALLAMGLHIHIIFARLSMLRPRLFGDADIEEAKYRRLR